MANEPAPLLDESRAAELLAVKRSTLANWRRRGKGPVFVKLGRVVRYREADLARFVAQRLVHPVEHLAAVQTGWRVPFRGA